MRIQWLTAAWLVVGFGCTEINPSYQADLQPPPLDQRIADGQVAPEPDPRPDSLRPFDRHPDLSLPDLAPLADAGTPDSPTPQPNDASVSDAPWLPDASVPDSDPCAAVDCTAAHAAGACVGGVCQGYQCDAGWGDCNNSFADGCETDLITDGLHCGACGSVCAAVPNADVACVGGSCAVSCIAPYEDCNNDPKDGCEIPVGVADSCNPGGLSTFSAAAGATPGCGTPHCGTGGPGSVSFGSWYCSFCAHCEKFADGFAWCVPTSGTYSSQRCSKCCKPNDPSYPAVCQP